ncbi:MAG TPA: O-antigen ligase family protein [Terracidiphilus sp.]|nr:O-antigen ligase family protein [Terracidiphilus sp.]
MRAAARMLLWLFVFAIPWEYSLDFGPPWGNIARFIGLLTLAASLLAVLQAGGVRRLHAAHGLTLALFVWMCCSYLWSGDPATTLGKLPGYFQEMMIVWSVWELAEDADDLKLLLRAWLAGSWILAVLTLLNFAWLFAAGGAQIRFVAVGQDPNDAARYLDLAFPVVALLLNGKQGWFWRWASWGYLLVGPLAVFLTASRGGVLEAAIALGGSAWVLWRPHRRIVLAALYAAPLAAILLVSVLPAGTLDRIASLGDYARIQDLNQRVNIWGAGWRAFLQSPFFGHGAGTFVSAAGLSSIDTAHNTALDIAVEQGIAGLMLAAAILAAAAATVAAMQGASRIAFGTLLAVWCLASMVGTEGESRMTWLLFAVIAFAGRLGIHMSLSAEAEPAYALSPEPV